MDLERALARGKTIRVVGFDDAPFERGDVEVHVAGVVCAATRFEGMHWLQVTRDGTDATEALMQALQESKFLDQIHVILLDGIAFGGFNIVDLPALARELDRPAVAVMRRAPDMAAIERALENLDGTARRLALIRSAGPIHQLGRFTFQVQGAAPSVAAEALAALTDTGDVPEALRLAHMIGAAVKTGVSSNRA